jgi:hypothetical protein
MNGAITGAVNAPSTSRTGESTRMLTVMMAAERREKRKKSNGLIG